MEDVLTLFPFGNQVERIEISGQTLLDVLDVSIVKYDPNDLENPTGDFLQMSGT